MSVAASNKTKTKNAPLLVVDDDDSLRRVLEFQLTEGGYEVETATDGLSALEKFNTNEYSCLITDLRMPEMNGLELIKRANAIKPETPLIVITAFGDVETAVEAMRLGAFDFITKPFNREQILLTVEKALKFGDTISENRRLRRLVHEHFQLENVIGTSKAMKRVLDVVERVSQTDATVLITGESGTGKELIAKGIHFSGKRADAPFIAINCAAIPETLIESELFGHKKGSFTGAVADAKGKFEEASGGTIFLDEISAMPHSIQPKFLRVLQEQEVTRLGETTPRKVDVRIIAATNRDLKTMVEDNSFREDLYFRLAVVPIILPPLKQRREDIPLLVEHFLKRASDKYNRNEIKISREVFNVLSGYSWQGNVRELENTIERMVVLASGDTLTHDDLPEEIKQPKQNFANVSIELPHEGISIDAVEREIIRKALEMNDGNQTHTARYLDITRSALIYRMQKFGLSQNSSDGEKE